MFAIDMIFIRIGVKVAQSRAITRKPVPVVKREFAEMPVSNGSGVETMSHYNIDITSHLKPGHMRFSSRLGMSIPELRSLRINKCR